MLIALLIGTIIGFVIAVPPGPVSVSAAKLSVFSSKKSSTSFITATGLIDFFFALSTTFAATAIARAISSFTSSHILITNIIQISVVLLFILFGILSIIKSKKINSIEIKSNPKIPFLDRLAQRGPFFFGVAIATSNLANPTFLPSLGYLSIQVESLNYFTFDFGTKIFYAVGFGLGNFLWLYLMTSILHFNKDKISSLFQKRLQQFAGITFISFGTLLGYKLFQVIHWQDIFRIFLSFSF